MSAAQAIAIALVVVPALAFVLWPLLTGRGEGNAARGIAPGDAALELGEEKTSVYRALRELAFDHEAGHLSDDDYAALRARYESRAAEILGALDALGPHPPRPTPAAPVAPAPPAGRGLLRHPAALVGGALVLVVFGVVIGLNAGRFTAPDQTVIPPGSRIPVPAMTEPGPDDAARGRHRAGQADPARDAGRDAARGAREPGRRSDSPRRSPRTRPCSSVTRATWMR